MNDRLQRLQKMLAQVDADIEEAQLERTLKSLPGGPVQEGAVFEAVRTPAMGREIAMESLDLIRSDRMDQIDSDRQFVLEAIVMPMNRPVVDIIDDKIETSQLTPKWSHLQQENVRNKIEKSLLSVGRIEVPNILYAGTGFIVGDGVLMTNRHVAAIFAQGVGASNRITYKSNSASIDFYRENKGQKSDELKVEDVLMIHPYWDMALLKVSGLPDNREPLVLNTDKPSNHFDSDIVVIGYPGYDPNGDEKFQKTQATIFRNTYYVKRMQPGKFKERESLDSFDYHVNAVTHDSSTLGGNSGSCVLKLPTDPASNAMPQVVALHFAGSYLHANYGVPAYDLAQDKRVVDAGVKFAGELPAPDPGYTKVWSQIEKIESPASGGSNSGTNNPVQICTGGQGNGDGSATWTIPINVTISLGNPQQPVTVCTSGSTPIQDPPPVATDEGLFGSSEPEVDWGEFKLPPLNDPAFNWQATLSTAIASDLAYQQKTEVEKIAQQRWGFDTANFFSENTTQGFVASTGDLVFLSFRGTKEIRDWLVDIDIRSIDRPYGTVHRGFFEAFTDARTKMESLIGDLAGRKLVITGHSLGGALATIAAAEWQTKYDISTIYTYGQPAVGRGNFQAFFARHYSGKFFRVVNDRDIVARVPPNFFHVGKLIHFDADGGLKTDLSFTTESVGGDDMMTEAEFKRMKIMLLQQQVDPAGGNIQTESLGGPQQEGLFSPITDHFLKNYIRKIKLQLN